MARFSKEKSQDKPVVGRLVKLTIDISSNNGGVVVFRRKMKDQEEDYYALSSSSQVLC